MRAVLRKAFSFPVFLGALLVVGAFRGSLIFIVEGDTWWHLKVGQQILQTRNWPSTDPYSFTVSGHDWIAYGWLGEVVMALVAPLGDLRALTALLIALSATLLLLLYYYCYLRSGNIKAAFVACVLLLPMAALFFILRPQLLGYIFLLLTLIFLERFRQGQQKSLWLLPLLFLLWVNTHGTFPLGLLVMGVYWASGLVGFRLGGVVGERWTAEQRRHLLLVFLLCVLALSITPYGTRLAAYPGEMALFQPGVTAKIGEWEPISFRPILWKLFLGLLLLFFLAQVAFGLRYRLEEIGLLLFGVYTTSVHRRFALFFILVFAPLLATLLARWIPAYQPAKDRYVLNASLMVLIGVGLVTFFPTGAELERIAEKWTPRQAVEYLRQHPLGRPMLNESDWGGYLIWALGPEHKVFIDGRADIYEYAGVLSDYFRMIYVEPDTLFLLQKYGVQACLLRRNAPLGTFLAALPDWEQVYADDLSALFVRRGGAPVRFMQRSKR